MKKYSKNKLKFRRAIVVIALLLLLALILGIILLTCFCFRSTITKKVEDNSANTVSDDVAINSSPVVIDNLIVGALYNSRWVSSNRYYLKSNNKSNVEIDVYTKNNKAGTYVIEELYTSGNSVFVNTNYVNYIDEYFAIPTSTNYSLTSNFTSEQIQEKDYEYVKKALGLLLIYNDSINIKNVYSGYIDTQTPIRIITVTSESRGIFDGIYSGIIVAYPNDNRANIVEYYYTKDFENVDDFPLYSLEFLVDLNGDGKSEIVTRAVTEFNVTYDIFEYQKNKFVQVLSEKMMAN